MPLSRGLDVSLIKWIERLAQGSKDPPFSANSCLGQQSSTQGRSQAYKCKVGATEGRDEPEGGQPVSPRPAGLARACVDVKQLSTASRSKSEPLSKSRWPRGRIPRPAGLGEAGRPHLAAARAQLHVEATSTVLVAYNTRTHLVPTLEHYK